MWEMCFGMCVSCVFNVCFCAHGVDNEYMREMCFVMCVSCVFKICFCAHGVCSCVGKQKSSYAGDQFLYV